ncbi:hypothetical protein Poli38472_002760 [Pythium oligandrum]|uniref:SRR1-like domain-containing protein n=1 Tax=Pythium oligandrum TaxID=41045 RepID=A0A8K1CHS0_PYTOL|nr:hypothetical protein Poli38472_002760 [Pythium oligandrum]|eukprot:TMW63819.1 hypothetical protein Poli38472_002760 [Pythium oligandrum]
MADGEWILVRRQTTKRRAPAKATARMGHHSVAHKTSSQQNVMEAFDPNTRVSDAKRATIEAQVDRVSQILLSNEAVLADILLGIKALLTSLEPEKAPEQALHIVNYGLGSFCSSTNATYQLAFIKALAEAVRKAHPTVQLTLEIYDPVMNASDRDIASHFGVATIEENECAKREVQTKTVFFMPHCGKTLYENVLATNWTSRLGDTVVIGNSFEAYSDRLIDSTARKSSLLVRVLPYISETTVSLNVLRDRDDFTLFEAAFNDLSIHTFPNETLEAALGDEELGVIVANVLNPSNDDERDDRELIKASSTA